MKYLKFLFFKSWDLNPLFGEGNGTPLQYSCLENPMDGGAWWAAVHEVAKSQTQLSDFTFTFHFHASEKEMATHSSVLAWRIPGTGKPGGLPSMGSHRVGHDWSNLAAAAAAHCCQLRCRTPFISLEATTVSTHVIWIVLNWFQKVHNYPSDMTKFQSEVGFFFFAFLSLKKD